MAYCDTSFADGYFETRAFSGNWTGGEKEQFLETASNNIKDFCVFEKDDGKRTKYIYDENIDIIPDWLKRATCEQALHLLNLAKDPTQNDKKTTLGISSSEGNVFDKSFKADILSPICIKILENNGGIVDGAACGGRGISFGQVVK